MRKAQNHVLTLLGKQILKICSWILGANQLAYTLVLPAFGFERARHPALLLLSLPASQAHIVGSPGGREQGILPFSTVTPSNLCTNVGRRTPRHQHETFTVNVFTCARPRPYDRRASFFGSRKIDTIRNAFSIDSEATGVGAKEGPRTSALTFSGEKQT